MMSTGSILLLAAVAGALLALMILAAALRVVRFWIKALLAVLAFGLLLPSGGLIVALHPEWIDGRLRTYRAFYANIEVGMDRAAVFRLLERQYPAAGPRARPKLVVDEPGRLGFFMNPERSPEPNCEGIFLTLTNGRVARKEYSAD
ncbi:MAG: hypothetical protein RJA22_2520 [Verrucomicrobiota bacterium]|jgi:hypothetical protein